MSKPPRCFLPLSQAAENFSPAAQVGVFAVLRTGMLFPALQAGALFAAPSSFSLPEKEERPAGVEEKEGNSRSVGAATPIGAERLSHTFRSSCGLRPKAAAAEKSRAPILLHLSGRNNVI